MTDEQIGGKIQLKVSGTPGEVRTKYPCTMCSAFNTAACDSCKCNLCTVEEQKCPKCKNRPGTIIQYYLLFGKPLAGENWESADVFACTRCGGVIKKKWDQLPAYDKCPRCNNVYYLIPSFSGTRKGCLQGAHRPGMDWRKEDIFKCPNCKSYFYVPKNQLPGYRICNTCKKQYYCYPSASQKRKLF